MKSEESPGRGCRGGQRRDVPAHAAKLRDMIADGGVTLDELRDDIEEVRALVKAGEARLEVKVLPWGLEFALVSAVPRRAPSLGSEPTTLPFIAR